VEKPAYAGCSAPRADQEADNGKGPNGVDTCRCRTRVIGALGLQETHPLDYAHLKPKFEIGGNAEAAGK
jgi:hypothetical protein